MAFSDNETGATTSQPVELYTFVGTRNTYRYTSADTNIVSNGQTYLARSIQRNRLETGTQDDDLLALEITFPYDDPLAVEYGYDVAPPKLDFELVRAHRPDLNDTRRLWSGQVSGFQIKGRTIAARVPSTFASLLAQPLPRPRYQGPDNHLLYSEQNGINGTAPENQQTTDVLTLVDGLTVIVTDTSLNRDHLVGGEIIRDSDEERRLITNVLDNSDGTTTLIFAFPFSQIEVGDDVRLRRGSDYSIGPDGSGRFNNEINFGGFPLVPDLNPFADRFGGTGQNSGGISTADLLSGLLSGNIEADVILEQDP